MIEKYQRLFQLDVYHSYFQKSICRCLEFNADSATEQLMKRFRLLIRRQINGIGLYGNASQPLKELLTYIEQVTGQHAFCFEMRTNNPDFNFFTELPPNWVGQLLYDSSNITVDDQNIQLNQELSGNPGTNCIGKVTLRFADILKFDKDMGTVSFDIKLMARATQWQYFIINRNALPLDNLAISGKEPIDFEGPENVVMETSQNALLFSSGSKLIPLSEVPVHKFDLINHPPSNDNKTVQPQIIIKGLPTPIPEWIGKVTDNAAEQLSSPMYVYL
ncbi:hypothetical protein [Pedobacter alluvionis]|uniref:Uncharacterized protein n=1 Tax=Pedobacter alluvionis TaxID=475253 RepID=A0A497YH49_9SPHI|nr:hypothetical protein [Pedobacter alluvionis]RLJ80639.1 hypothetical protein BCL90_1430 [Pedobacter alluvionis]TFB31898.1 hypothetical protein E3V97_15105 [Pedobacter alluvionis]